MPIHYNSLDEFERVERIRQANEEKAAHWYDRINRTLPFRYRFYLKMKSLERWFSEDPEREFIAGTLFLFLLSVLIAKLLLSLPIE